MQSAEALLLDAKHAETLLLELLPGHYLVETIENT